MSESFSLSNHLENIDSAQWNRLAGGHPLLSHEFLLALDQTGCASVRTGWAPHYLLLHRAGRLEAAMPLYLKTHSRGEYVFDHGWARAFESHGLPYYPKLLSAVPFTPVPGPRLLASTHTDKVLLAKKAIQITEDNRVSSLHVLFPTEDDRAALGEAGFLFRENVQFHWFNHNYADFDDFLARLSQQKRKKLRQDRKKVLQAGVRFRWLEGDAIDADILDFFYRCYHQTYLEHGNAPYLSLAFFKQMRRVMADNMLIIVAEQDGRPIASALNIRGDETLYGRYWGSLQFVSGLHFETCYTQAIEYCIVRGMRIFEGGAQGEHKLSRGLMPVQTCSAHWIRDQRYAHAISDFLARETPAIEEYISELHEHSPFRKPD